MYHVGAATCRSFVSTIALQLVCVCLSERVSFHQCTAMLVGRWQNFVASEVKGDTVCEMQA
jgi:hypothetical protein